MKSQKQKSFAGYTIIEVMIFLAVSSALLVSVMTIVSGRQERTLFTQSVESFERKLNDALNDVSTGYYPSADNITCTAAADNVLTINSGGAEQGTNAGCVFVGKAIEFGGSTLRLGPSQYNIYTMVGSKEGTNLESAKIKLLGENGNPGIKEENEILADIEIIKVVEHEPSGGDLAGLALVSEFSQTSTLNNKVSGNATRVSLYEVSAPFLSKAGKPDMQFANKGVTVCLQQGGLNGRKAAVILGANGGRVSSEVKIDEWPGECA